MKNTKRALAAVALVALFVTGASAQEKVRIAVGGKSAVFYLPLSVAERLGSFKDAGLDVEISDVASGGRTLQAIVGGSAEIGIGTFDHAIQMQAKNQPVVALLQYGRYPGFVLAMMAGKADLYKTPKDLKGLKIGVTSPGSSTHFMAAYMMVRAGLKQDDASFIGTGTTSTAVAAARRAEIDAIVSSDPMMTMMETEKLVKIVADTRTADGTKAVYGGPYPGGVIYATPAYIEKNPQTVQKVVDCLQQRTEMDREPFGRGHRQADAGGIRARQSAALCQGAVRFEADVFARRPLRAGRRRDGLCGAAGCSIRRWRPRASI